MTTKDIQKAIAEARAKRLDPLDMLAERVVFAGFAPDMEAGRRFVMKHEAHARLQAMGIFHKAVQEFMEKGLLNRSETCLGSLYWLSDEERQLVKNWEQETGNMVYHVVKAGSEAGELGVMYSFLYVGKDMGEWLIDREDISEKTPWTYTYCHTYPDFSEPGRIGVEYRFGGVVRVA